MRINVSELLALQKCPSYWWATYMAKKRAAGPEAAALTLGTLAHTRLAAAMRNEVSKSIASQITDVEQLPMAEALDERISYWDAQPHPWDGAVIHVEKDLEMPLGTIDTKPLVLFGRPDAVVIYQDKLWHVQHKTLGASTQIGMFARTIQRSLHERAYAALIQEHFPHRPYGGTMLNIIRKLAPTTNRNGKRINRPPGEALHLEFLPIEQEQIRKSLEDMRYWAGEALRYAQMAQSGALPPPSHTMQMARLPQISDCVIYHRLCPFIDVCDGWDSLESQNFQDKDPLAHYAVAATAEGEDL